MTVNGTGGNDTIAVVRNAATDTVQVNAALKRTSVTSADTSGLVVATGWAWTRSTSAAAGGPALTVAGGQSPASDTLNVTNSAARARPRVTPGAPTMPARS